MEERFAVAIHSTERQVLQNIGRFGGEKSLQVWKKCSTPK